MGERSLVWFTKDLRIQDNEFLSSLSQSQTSVVALVFKPLGLSAGQQEFFRQSAMDLQNSLALKNIKLYCIEGSPELEIVKWVQENSIQFVFASSVYNTRDQQTIDKVAIALKANTKAHFKAFDQSTLLHADDIRFVLNRLHPTFTPFRKLVEESWTVRDVALTDFKNLLGFTPIIPPSTQLVDLANSDGAPNLPYHLNGGETAAWQRLKEFLWETRSIDSYKDNRNGMLEKNDSSKFSPWLANGCMSSRSLYHEIKAYEQTYAANDSTYWLIFELLWRDYFKFHSLKIGEQLFKVDGFLKKIKPWLDDEESFLRWCQGETGVDFVDANMKELVQTGWMSNRGRQNVASYFSKQLKMSWTRGAEFFEKHLLDYDVESNWGNWQYLAGVGTDPRDRDFNIQRQAEHYDPDFKYRNKWLGDSSVGGQ